MAKCGKAQEENPGTIDQVFIVFKDDCTTVHFEDPRGDGPERYSVTFDSTETETVVQIRRKRKVSGKLNNRPEKHRKVVKNYMKGLREPRDVKLKEEIQVERGKDKLETGLVKPSEKLIREKDSPREKAQLEVDSTKQRNAVESFNKVKENLSKEKGRNDLQRNFANQSVDENSKKVQRDTAELEIILEKDSPISKSSGNRNTCAANGTARQNGKQLKENVQRRNPFSRSLEDDNSALSDVIEILDDESVEPDVLPVITSAYNLKNAQPMRKGRRT